MNVILTSNEDRKLNESFSKKGKFEFYCRWRDIGLKFIQYIFVYSSRDSNEMESHHILCKIINEKKFKFACITAGVSPKLIECTHSLAKTK